MRRPIFLIASYPKSGNTWVRLVLQRLLDARDCVHSDTEQQQQQPNINAIRIGLYGHERRIAFDQRAPANAAELLPDEIDCLLPGIYEQLARESPGSLYIKTHERLRRNRDGGWIFPPQQVAAALYIARHPFDVAVSQGNHLGISLEAAVALLGDSRGAIAVSGRTLPMPLQEFSGSWSGNVASWLGSPAPFPIHLVRYEDLCANDVESFAGLATAAGVEVSPDVLERVVTESRFDRVQAAEQAMGFRERPRTSPAFFRSGKPGGWRGLLDEALQEQLVSEHGPAMGRLGYLADGSWLPLAEIGGQAIES